MPDSDKSLNVFIRIGADTAGANQATQALNDAKKAAEDAGNAVDKTTLSHSNLHKIIHALNGVLPGFGTAFQAVFSWQSAAIGGVILLLEKFREHIRVVNEELDKQGDEALKPLTEQLKINKDLTDQSAMSALQWKEKLTEAQTILVSLADQLTRNIELQKEQQKVQAGAINTTQTIELQRLEQLHKQKLISEEDYLQKKLQLQKKYDALARARELEELGQSLDQKEEAIKGAEGKQIELRRRVTVATSDAEAAGRTLANNKALTPAAQKELDLQIERFGQLKQTLGSSTVDRFIEYGRQNITSPDQLKQMGVGKWVDQYGQSHDSLYGAQREFEKFQEFQTAQTRVNTARAQLTKAYENEANSNLDVESSKTALQNAQNRLTENLNFVAKNRDELAFGDAQWEEKRKANLKLNQQDATRRNAENLTELSGTPFSGAILRGIEMYQSGRHDAEARAAVRMAENLAREGGLPQQRLLHNLSMIKEHNDQFYQILSKMLEIENRRQAQLRRLQNIN